MFRTAHGSPSHAPPGDEAARAADAGERSSSRHARLARLGPTLVVALATVVFAARLFWLIHRHAVDLLIWDNWDFYDSRFDGSSLWHVFTQRHGPHRQGVGFLVTAALDALTAWDTRAHAYAVGVTLMLAAVAALWLKRRVVGPLTYWDAVIPLVVLTPAQWQHFAGVINLSHSAMPLLLLLLYVAAWFARRPAVRYALVLALNFLLIFTGFGLFVGLITPLLLLAEAARLAQRLHDAGRRRAWLVPAAAVVVAAASGALFFVDYRMEPSVEGFVFPHPDPTIYPLFAAKMLGRFFGFFDQRGDTFAFGFFLLAAMAAATTYGVVRLARSARSNPAADAPPDALGVTLAVLGGFGLIYTAFVAVGRAPGGLELADASRYVTLMVPGFLAAYFAAHRLPSAWPRRLTLGLLCTLAVVGNGPVSTWDDYGMWQVATLKRTWVRNHLAGGATIRGDDPTLLELHPRPVESRVPEKLAYLKSRRLSLYRDLPPDDVRVAPAPVTGLTPPAPPATAPR